jgi:hypothetical protein
MNRKSRELLKSSAVAIIAGRTGAALKGFSVTSGAVLIRLIVTWTVPGPSQFGSMSFRA